MKKTFLYSTIIATSLLSACGEQTPEVVESPETPAVVEDAPYSEQIDNLLVYEAETATEYPNASLTMTSPASGEAVAGTNAFSFEVKDYELGIQTEEAEERNCANSAKGQHIHFILNNAPYKAKYEASFEEDLEEGNNVLLAFISRSYHESIKNGSAYEIRQINTSGGEGEYDLDNDPHLFYSRPKGSYDYSESTRILLDFYLINTDLAGNGNKVRATINGKVFELPKWAPYFIEGLPLGENTVRLELIDKDGNPVPGPFNDSGERSFTITQG